MKSVNHDLSESIEITKIGLAVIKIIGFEDGTSQLFLIFEASYLKNRKSIFGVDGIL